MIYLKNDPPHALGRFLQVVIFIFQNKTKNLADVTRKI